MNSTKTSSDFFAKELQEFKDALKASGIHGALHYLNTRTPHRYTGIYKFDGENLRNLALYDRFDSTLTKGEDAPMSATYCSLVQKQQALEITDATEDSRVKGKIITPVVSYCGVLLRDADGKPFGTLCHFDMQRCQERISDFPLLKAAAGILYSYLHS
ncbi:hypothetical protein ACFSRY_04880 [Pontibacter locisalis]|uniref:GAF domain-containing protein n=1 Tax=Pontibacter locisalis TaxID=1719035 RepID=A0ABW5IIX1_9BACT